MQRRPSTSSGRISCWRLLIAAAFVLTIAGCGDAPVRSGAGVVPVQALVWPKPPAQARIRFVRNIGTPADWGLDRGPMQRLMDKFTGDVPFRFVRPTSVVAHAGKLYVADPGMQALIIFDPGKPQELKIDRLGAQALASPVAVALGQNGTILLADSALRQVFVLDGEGRLLRTIAGEGRVSRPAGLAYDPAADRLYVADSAAHRIVVFSGDGRMLEAFGSNGSAPGEFNFPTHLAVTRDGRLIVTDSLNFRVQVLTSDGQPVRRFGRAGDGSGDFASPKGIAADKAGNVYVVDALFDAVQVFGPDGALLLGFGERGTQPGRLWLPNGLFMDDNDMLYVADSYNQRISQFQRLDGAARAGDQ
jgi:DNA-binding beta-propeller fold protein YncE